MCFDCAAADVGRLPPRAVRSHLCLRPLAPPVLHCDLERACRSAMNPGVLTYAIPVLYALLVLSGLCVLWGAVRAFFGRTTRGMSASVLVFAVLCAQVFVVVPLFVESALNRVTPDPYAVSISEESAELHSQLFVVDMHSDSLLWNRDITTRSSSGHVDVVRLIEGKVALQGFTIATSVPVGLNFERNHRPGLLSDIVTAMAIAARWGLKEVSSLPARTLFQIERLHHYAEKSNGKLVIIKYKEDLEKHVSDITAAYLGIEGAHAIGHDILNVDVFASAGVRTFGLVHFFDNEIGGSMHGHEKGALTDFGRRVLFRAEEKQMLIDVAHSSEATVLEACSLAKKPVVNSHTGVRGVCNNTRNLSDRAIKAIAATGGVIGIGFFPPAICGESTTKSIIDSIEHVRNLVGVKHVALGSDYDGATKVPFDVASIGLLTAHMLEREYDRQDIADIMGGNMLRLMQEHLPARTRP